MVKEIDNIFNNWSKGMNISDPLFKVCSKEDMESHKLIEKYHNKSLKNSIKSPESEKYFEYVAWRKTDTLFESGKSYALSSLLSEPIERTRQYFWFATNLLSHTNKKEKDYLKLTKLIEFLHVGYGQYYNKEEMQRVQIERLKLEKEQLYNKLQIVSKTKEVYRVKNKNKPKQKAHVEINVEQLKTHSQELKKNYQETDNNFKRVLMENQLMKIEKWVLEREHITKVNYLDTQLQSLSKQLENMEQLKEMISLKNMQEQQKQIEEKENQIIEVIFIFIDLLF